MSDKTSFQHRSICACEWCAPIREARELKRVRELKTARVSEPAWTPEPSCLMWHAVAGTKAGGSTSMPRVESLEQDGWAVVKPHHWYRGTFLMRKNLS